MCGGVKVHKGMRDKIAGTGKGWHGRVSIPKKQNGAMAYTGRLLTY